MDPRKQGYEEYLKSDDWKRLRQNKLEEANGICNHCKNPLGATPHCHHESYDNFGHEDYEDTSIIHKRCHEFKHGIKEVKEDD